MTSVRRRLFTVLLLVFAVAALGTTSLCSAASGPPQGFPYEKRTDTFRRLLFELHFEPLPSFAELCENPSESLLILLGDPGCLSKINFSDGLRDFVAQGGAVLIATDKETGGEAGRMLNNLAGVTVTGKTLVYRGAKTEEIYNNLPFCPFVVPIDRFTTLKITPNLLSMLTAYASSADRPALFRNPHSNRSNLRVVTNAPSYLMMSRGSLPEGIYRLARLPGECQDESAPVRLVDEMGPLFAVGGTVGKGRVLVLADHSIFINRMILPRDNDNLEFAINCLHWLRGGSQRFIDSRDTITRNKVLFWDDGHVQNNFEVPLKKVSGQLPPMIPPEPVIVAAFDQTIADLEANDSFNRALLQHIDDLPGGWPRVIRNTVYLLTLAAALFLAYRFLWRSRHRAELATPSLAEALRRHEPRASLLDQRRRALLRSGNVWEMGHRLARECFESAGVALTGASQPRVRVMQGSGWQRWRERRRVVRLWRLARGEAMTPISPIALQRLQHELEQLKNALADGTIQFRA